jgi:hypothetical protein
MRRPELPPRSLSAGVVVIRRDAQRFRMLCVRALDRWDFPKAAVAEGADALVAALAEVREVAGLEQLEFPWGEDYRETVPFADGRVSRYYLARVRDADATQPVPVGRQPTTGPDLRWLTYEEAEELLPPSLSLVLDWAVQRLASGGTRPAGAPG